MRFKLTVEYAGTRYSGWQIQKNARTIAGEIDQAVRKVTGRKDFELYGSGRTDAGVHARGQVASVRTETRHDLATLERGLNAILPEDVAVLDELVEQDRVPGLDRLGVGVGAQAPLA